MLSSISNTATSEDTFLDIDNEIDDEKNIATIDTAHQFLNFSRKVTEASSMRKPVDIQLGIACGKDLIFGSSGLLLQQRHQKPSLSSLAKKKSTVLSPTSEQKNNIINKTADLTTPVKVLSSPQTSLEKKPSIKALKTIPHTNTNYKSNHNGGSKEVKHRSLPLQTQKYYSNNNIDNNNDNKLTTTNPSSSPLLDRLVADVLSHIESCPDRSAYSDDLDKLKPKLQAYSVTRLPPSLKSS